MGHRKIIQWSELWLGIKISKFEIHFTINNLCDCLPSMKTLGLISSTTKKCYVTLGKALNMSEIQVSQWLIF
jgi:hypothetical protein